MIDTECPHCEQETDLDIGISDIGLWFKCPHCGKRIVVNGDYCDAEESNWYLVFEAE